MPSPHQTLKISDLIKHLNSNNIKTNSNNTHSFLNFINYSLLKPYITITPKDNTTNTAEIQQIVKHYDFDRKLKLLLWDGLERIEVACRSVLSLIMIEETLDEQWMFNVSNYTKYTNPYKVLIKYFSEQNIRQYLLKNSHTLIPEWENIMSICKDIKFNNFSVDFYSDLERHPKFNNDIDHLLKTNINIAHQNIQDYINNSVKLSSLSLLLGYMFSKLNVPFYIIMNKLDFGKTNIIINNLIPFYRDKIAKRFSISLNDDDFSQHIEHFQKIRNKIAHHEPLCKSKFDPIKNFSNFSNFNNDLINSHKNLIIFYLDMIAPRNTLNDKISNLIIQYKKRYNIDFTAWGFDNNTTI